MCLLEMPLFKNSFRESFCKKVGSRLVQGRSVDLFRLLLTVFNLLASVRLGRYIGASNGKIIPFASKTPTSSHYRSFGTFRLSLTVCGLFAIFDALISVTDWK